VATVANPRLELVDGRSIELDAGVASRLAAAVLVAEDVRVREKPEVWERTAVLGERLRRLHGGSQPSRIPGLQEARELYKSFGMEPTRHRPSSEALLRRTLRGQDLYHINNVVDCANLASLSFLLPIGLYDLDRVEGDVLLRVGRPGEEYDGIRKGPVHLAGRLGLFDARGPFGTPTSDSARTAIAFDTTRLFAIVMATWTYPPDRLDAHSALLADLFAQYCSARIRQSAILRRESGE
jgi:DNA/RNA-binding domain of Phe-tRNA-synthetase-like protein